jgi:hypothetical protein
VSKKYSSPRRHTPLKNAGKPPLQGRENSRGSEAQSTMPTSTQVHHFLLTPDHRLQEFSSEQAARVAAGAGRLPEFADRSVRYLQVTVRQESDDELKVVTAGARIRFDHDGRLTEAAPIGERDERISHFEHDAAVQWALRQWPAEPLAYH